MDPRACIATIYILVSYIAVVVQFSSYAIIKPGARLVS